MSWIKAIFAGLLLPLLLGSIYYFYLSIGSGLPFNKTIFFVTIFLSYWLVALVGIPAIISFKSRKSIRLKHSIFIGILVALLAVFLLFGFSFMFPPLSQLIIFIFMGAIAGVVVWYVFK